MRIMRLRHVPLPSTMRLVWDRITFSRLTIAYFAFSFIHAIIQLSLQIKAFTVNAEAASFLNDIVVQGAATNGSIPFLQGSSVYMCDIIPTPGDSGCYLVWSGTKGTNVVGQQTGAVAPTSLYPVSTASMSTPSVAVHSTTSAANLATTTSHGNSPSTVTIFVVPAPTSTTNLAHEGALMQDVTRRTDVTAVQSNGQTHVQINGMGFKNMQATLDSKCVGALNWPVSVLENTKREDLSFVAFQLWVLGVSFVALLNESIPHSLASLVTHMMATAWAAAKITDTARFRSDFGRVITNGACSGTLLLSNYWQERGAAEISSLALNICALFISCFLTWKLMKLFGWQTFKRVGASLTINRVYQIVLVLSIALQLCLYFIIVAVSLWLDQLFNTAVAKVTTFDKLYKITSIITLVLTIPWLTTGWFAIRRELRAPMLVFLILSLLYLVGWSAMFISGTFRWIFVTWPFFGITAAASVFLTVVCFILGVVCRLNFGKGLARYLNAQNGVPGDDDVYNDGSDTEKVEFPSNDKLIPTYSVAFQGGREVSPPSRWLSTQGPRLLNKLAQPFEAIARPKEAHALTRHRSDGSSDGHLLARSDTRSSDGSLRSGDGYPDSKHTRSGSQQKRWLIE